MEKVLFITDMPKSLKNGAGKNGKMHYEMVKSTYKTNGYFIFVNETYNNEDHNEYTFKKNNFLSKIITCLLGYPPYLYLNVRKKILHTIKKESISVVFFDNSVSGTFIRVIKKRFPLVKVCSFFIDIEKDLMMKNYKSVSLFRKFSIKTMIKNEKNTAIFADKKIVLNKRDFALYKEIYGSNPDGFLPVCSEFNDIDFSAVHEKNTKLNVLFVGADYWPNVQGIEWFIDSVLSKLPNRIASLTIVGLNMEKYKRDFESKNNNVRVLGTVEGIIGFYEKADIVVAPIKDGGGMKVKTGEALSYGKIILGTDESFLGYYDVSPYLDNMIVCNSADSYIKNLNALFSSTFLKCNKKKVEIAKSFFSKSALCKKIVSFIEE